MGVGLCGERLLLDVFHDADDFKRHRRVEVVDREVLAHGVFAREVAPPHRLVDDGGVRRPRAVMICELPSFEQADAHQAKVVRADGVVPSLWHLVRISPALNREGEKDAVDFLVIAEVGLVLDLCAILHPLGNDADLEEVIGIEVDVIYVTVLSDHPKLVGERSVHVLGAQIFNRAAFLFPIDERPVDLRGFDEIFGVVGRHFLRIFAPAERRDLPALGAVIGKHLGHSLEGCFLADLARLFLNQQVAELQLSIVHQDFPGKAERLHS